MSYKTVYKEIMRAYESDRDRAAATLRKRREEMYARLPRLREIDGELSSAGLSAARQIVIGDAPLKPNEALLADLGKRSAELKREKERLLSGSGMPKDYFTDIYRCGLCRDTGFADGERCRCLKQRLIDKYYDLSTIRGLLDNENFGTFDLRYYSEAVNAQQGLSPRKNMQLIQKAAQKLVDEFGQTFQNLLFYGATGLGKTFLCNCIAKALLDRGHTVLYVTAPRIFKLVEDYRFNRDEMEEPDYAIDAVTDVDLLILDDLGAEFSTVVTSAALFDIINQRIITKKPTVISTNLSILEFESNYSDRILSRFHGHYIMLKFYGDDIRAKKRHEGG